MKEILSAILFFSFFGAFSQTPAPLPPVMEWQGASEKLIRPVNDPWITPSEKSNFQFTASRSETINFFEKLARKTSLLTVKEMGKSSGGLPMPLVILSKDAAFHKNPSSKKPILLVQCGIHAGEIDGKDAAMMFARDVVLQKNELLDKVNILIVPIFNVEGHERISVNNRMNQRGPQNMGWRTNGRNLNLNRDYMKVETGEMQSMIALINKYNPSLYFDIHVTDGADYQYDITYGFIGNHGYSPNISNWLTANFKKDIDAGLTAAGHIPGPLLFSKNDANFKDGNLAYTFNPDFSHAYGDAIHLPTILVENHSLKPFRQRVLGTYILIESAVKLLAKSNSSLQTAIKADKNSNPTEIRVNWVFDQESTGSNTNPWESNNTNAKSQLMETHLGVISESAISTITGATFERFTGKKESFEMPVFENNTAKYTINLPKYYIIPAYQNEIIDKVKLHQIPFRTVRKDSTITAKIYVFDKPDFANSPFEGRFKVSSKSAQISVEKIIPAGSIIIENKQPKFMLAALLLEPQSPSSLFQWGFTNVIFNRTEYIEAYAMEPYMEQSLKVNALLKAKYNEKMKDEKFAKNPRAITQWFYENSPFIDNQYKKYPVLMVY